VLALVLLVVFALSTFHVHGHAAAMPDATLTAGLALDDGAHGADKAPDVPDRHVAVDCPLCALLSLMLAPGSTQADTPRAADRERFVLGRDTLRAPPLFEHHRPPMVRAV